MADLRLDTPSSVFMHILAYTCLALLLQLNHVEAVQVALSGNSTLTVPSAPVYFGSNLMDTNTVITGPSYYKGVGCASYTDIPQGAIVIVSRGSCKFVAKCDIAKAAGAGAIIMVNDVGGRAGAGLPFFPYTEYFPDTTLPMVMISLTNYQMFKNYTTNSNALITLRGDEWLNNPGECTTDGTCNGNGICAYGMCLCNMRTALGPQNCSWNGFALFTFTALVQFLFFIALALIMVFILRSTSPGKHIKIYMSLGLLFSFCSAMHYSLISVEYNNAASNAKVNHITAKVFNSISIGSGNSAIAVLCLFMFSMFINRFKRVMQIAVGTFCALQYILALLYLFIDISAYYPSWDAAKITKMSGYSLLIILILICFLALYCVISSIYLIKKLSNKTGTKTSIFVLMCLAVLELTFRVLGIVNDVTVYSFTVSSYASIYVQYTLTAVSDLLTGLFLLYYSVIMLKNYAKRSKHLDQN